MKNSIKLLIILFLLITNQSYSQGLKLVSDDQLSELPEIKNDALGFVENLPDSYSFERFVPSILEQSGASCVGFSSLYYGLSTMYNIKFNITDSNRKFASAFDPYFIYSIVKSRDGENCDEGSYISEAFDLLQKVGSKKMLFPPFLTCNTPWDEEKIINVLPYTKPYSIENWGTYPVDSEFLNKAKNAIYYDYPLVFGVEVTNSLYSKNPENVKGISNDGLWNPDPIEDRLGGHAMTIVGYDDNKFGGAFRVVNSWGTDYGDNGFLWIKYSDFISNVKVVYIMFLDEKINPDNNPQIDLGDFQRVDYQYKYTMEGQLNNDKFNGYGIFYLKENKTTYIGNFINGDMDGYFLLVDDDGLYESTVKNGEFLDFDKLGFSDEDNEVLENRLMAKKYFNTISERPLKKAIGVKKVYGLLD